MKYILGIRSSGQDTCVSLLRNGELVFSIEEERLNREKHTAQFPFKAIEACFKHEGIGWSEIHCITYYMRPWMEVFENIAHVVRYFPDSLRLLQAEYGGGARINFFKRLCTAMNVRGFLLKQYPTCEIPPIKYIEHHMAHAASCFFMSPYESAAILTLDGRGESATTVLSVGHQNKIKKLKEVSAPHSLGHLYSAFTWYLGFKPFYDEWKVMGMAGYGTDRYSEFFNSLIRYESRSFTLDLSFFEFHTKGAKSWFSSKLYDQLGPARKTDEPVTQRHFDIAHSLQKLIERTGLNLAVHLREISGSENLCLAGGVALNILMNSKIISEAGFKNVFVQPVSHDPGTTFGSSSYYYHAVLENPRQYSFTNPFLGTAYSDEEIETELKRCRIRYEKIHDTSARAALMIAKGNIIGWFQGRMEVGPRALGNRSILADPRDPNMKKRINDTIKKREEFRPFAPSVTDEAVDRFFEMPTKVMSPYMNISGKTKLEYVKSLPAVTHVDGTARVHTVSKELNLKFWELLNEFEKITGFPIVLNTSFNKNEPIVESPKNAIDCFKNAELDALFIGSFLVLKN